MQIAQIVFQAIAIYVKSSLKLTCELDTQYTLSHLSYNCELDTIKKGGSESQFGDNSTQLNIKFSVTE